MQLNNVGLILMRRQALCHVVVVVVALFSCSVVQLLLVCCSLWLPNLAMQHLRLRICPFPLARDPNSATHE